MRRATLVILASFAVVRFSGSAAPDEQGGEAVGHSVTVDRLKRKYLIFAPKGFDKRLPMVMALHGGGSNPRQMERYTRFNALVAREGFLVVYPEAVDGNWNDVRGIPGVRAQHENIDDVKFMRRIVDHLSETHKIDRSRIYGTGVSNSASMSHLLAAEASDLIAAIVPVVGGMAPMRRTSIPLTQSPS
jgi:polyhydroxybutyrate depolymerase